MNKRKQTIKYILTDFFLATITWMLFNLLRFYEIAQFNFSSLSDYMFFHQVLSGQVLIPLFWLVIYFFSGYYNKPFGKSRLAELFSTFVSVSIGCVLIFFIVVLNDLPQSFRSYYKLFFALYGMQFCFTYIGRTLITNHASRKRRQRKWIENVLIIGTGQKALEISKSLHELNYQIIGFVRENSKPGMPVVQPYEIAGTIDDIAETVKNNKVDEFVIATEDNNIAKILYRLYAHGKPIKVLVEKNDILSKIKAKTVHSIPLVDVTENNFSGVEKNAKWLMDKVFASCFLLIFAPVYMYIALKIKSSSKGPIFFKQERIGYMGKTFTIYKFRTMYADAAKQGPLLTSVRDKRVTPYGRFLRKYRLDEIPQFWNVLKGDMSLVGPRPEQKYFIERIVEKAPYYYLLHNVKPGITSWGMVKYGYAENVDEMIIRLDYDLLYYENMSLILDITILTYTIKVVLTGKGV